MLERLGIQSIWTLECWRNGAQVWETTNHNIMVTEGRNGMLSTTFAGGTQITSWYILLFESDTSPDSDTTYATPVFTECTTYSESTRSAYVPATPAGGLVTNAASKGTFTFTADKSIYGGALVGGGSAASTKGNVAGGGTLMCAAQFTDVKQALVDDILRVTVAIQLNAV